MHYILTKNQADANAARKALIQGSSFPAEVKKYSLDAASNPSGALTATQGQVETNFANAVFAGLVTGGISPPVEVDSSYAVIEPGRQVQAQLLLRDPRRR